MQNFIDVILPIPLEKLFTYRVTQEESDFLLPGMRVAVPFGTSKIYTALVHEVHAKAPEAYEAKHIHQILSEYLEQYRAQITHDLRGIKGVFNKLRKLIWSHINVYATNRVFAKVLLIEVRNYPDYYKSETYDRVKEYSDIVLNIIEEGIQNKDIRDDISPKLMRYGILGSIEQVCLSGITFGRQAQEGGSGAVRSRCADRAVV